MIKVTLKGRPEDGWSGGVTGVVMYPQDQDVEVEQIPCAGLFGRLFGHRYRPRYSRRLAENVALKRYRVQGISVGSMIDEIGDRIYEGDVCERCGLRADQPRGEEG